MGKTVCGVIISDKKGGCRIITAASLSVILSQSEAVDGKFQFLCLIVQFSCRCR